MGHAAISEMMHKRLAKEIAELQTRPVEGVEVVVKDDIREIDASESPDTVWV